MVNVKIIRFASAGDKILFRCSIRDNGKERDENGMIYSFPGSQGKGAMLHDVGRLRGVTEKRRDFESARRKAK